MAEKSILRRVKTEWSAPSMIAAGELNMAIGSLPAQTIKKVGWVFVCHFDFSHFLVTQQ
jgi:hypothetical protein